MPAFSVSVASAAKEPQSGFPPIVPVSIWAVLVLLLLLPRRSAPARRVPVEVPEAPDRDEEADILPAEDVDILDRSVPTAVFLVGGREDVSAATLRAFAESYTGECRQALFLAVGLIDASVVDPGHPSPDPFERSTPAKRLRRFTRLFLDPYLSAAHRLGLKADCRISIATDPAKEMGRMIDGVVRGYPQVRFFVGKLVFEHSRWYHRVLHAGTSDRIRESLEKRGIPVTVIPVVLPDDQMATAARN
jgi:hypothetical protein